MEIELSEREAEELPCPRDLLRRLSSTRCSGELLPLKDFDEGDAELSLGLSLGGCFAADSKETRLLRSSSTAMISMLPKEADFALSSAPLVRSCSLPAEGEEEHLKRKEMQGLKRMEAKRKCLERSRWDVEAMRRRSSDFDGRGLRGSKASSLSSSSAVPSMPDSDLKSVAAAPLPPLLRSLKSFQEDDLVLKRMTGNLNGSKDFGRNLMAEMPCVSTKGGGPNGRRIEGFLYKYTKGEVRIVCVCHGSFHTPAEFIKHAGGGDVENPLRHIVVAPTPNY